MEQTQNSSRRLLWAVVGAVVVVALVVVIAVVALLGTKKEPAAKTQASTQSQSVTKAQVQQDLSELDSTMKQASADRAAAKAAIKDGTNQVKVGN